MSHSVDILRSYVAVLARFSEAASVSLYVPATRAGEHEILVHEGAADPVPELADADAATSLHAAFGAGQMGPGERSGDVLRLASRSADGVLFRIPLRWAIAPADDGGAAPERRKADSRPRTDPAAWVGLRLSDRAAGARAAAFPLEPRGDEAWWGRFLGLAAAFAAHARTVSRTLIDAVTGLPDRSEFQIELDATLAQARQTGLAAALLFVGPDDFGWVNERFDRRSGDQVLWEIAGALRGLLRSHDHVARYGGAIFTVVLQETSLEDGRLVADSLVRRLNEHRYHGGALRLGFSVGVAIADPGERPAVDAHELIRRADQALSAAKRGHGGSVRLWERGSDVESASSLDRLQGIFTGDKAKDYRNMMLLLDSVAVVAASTDPAELALSISEQLFDTLHPQRVAVFDLGEDGSFELLGGLQRGPNGRQSFEVSGADVAVAERSCREEGLVVQGGGETGEPSLWALPLRLEGRCLGCIVMGLGSASLSFEGSDRRVLDALASEMAVALDRARLTQRERQRQREERDRLEAELKDLRRVVHGTRIAYRSPVMETVLTAARKVAPTDATVLITGESGTGKEVLARTVHGLSARHDRPLVVVDCSAISPTLIESELFGHERGAFTGAHVRKPGRLAQAEGATVFLDEIGDLPLDMQSKLLRFVQEKQFTPVGSVTPRAVDVRIIAATNAELRSKVAQGTFREDLFHRLNVVRLHVPPLRERKEDILHLATMFLQQFAALYRRPALHFSPPAERALEDYEWPGNVRELQNLILTAVLFSDSREVGLEDLQGIAAANVAAAVTAATGAPPPPPAPPRAATEAGAATDDGPPGDPADRLRSALRRELAAAVRAPRAVAPLGKWLVEDLVLTADRLSAGVLRRGAELLGVPETTYRRQLQKASGKREAGLGMRSATWPDVAETLEALLRAPHPGTDVCDWAEACLLAEIVALGPRDVRTAAALLGVTEPTLLRRTSRLQTGNLAFGGRSSSRT